MTDSPGEEPEFREGSLEGGEFVFWRREQRLTRGSHIETCLPTAHDSHRVLQTREDVLTSLLRCTTHI